MIFFVYKFKVKPTGHFYIGVTTDIDVRKIWHVSKINVLIAQVITGHGNSHRRFPGQFVVAKAIVAKGGNLLIHGRVDKSKCVMEVLDIMDTPKEAADLETKHLQRNKNNPKCFNNQKTSNYSYLQK